METPNHSHDQQHFLLCPFMAQGHMIPMVDMARLFARRGVYVSFVTTPLNASRVRPTIDRASRCSNLPIRLVELRFPCEEAGLPEGIENVDVLPPSIDLFKRFIEGTKLLKHPLELFLSADRDFPPPTCVVSDFLLPWTLDVARGLGIPRLVFHGTCSYSLIVMESVRRYGLWDAADRPKKETMVTIPDMPCQFEMKKGLLPIPLSCGGLADFEGGAVKAELDSDGVVINSFDELEAKFTEAYGKLMGNEAYNIGPLSLCEGGVQAERGNKSSIDQEKCLSWLDSHKQGSVVYVSFGTLVRLGLRQVMEIGEAMKGSGRPVVWVLKQGKEGSEEIESWVSRFGEGLDWMVIVGWAPQVAILSHAAVGGFVTHCGWNSTLEGLCAGVPMVTWPHFWEQFVNERLVVEVLKVGVRVGIEVQTEWTKEEVMGREEIGVALENVMGGGEEGEERRRRVRVVGEMAKKAMEVGGSSYVNMTRLIEDVKGYVKENVVEDA
ncbi:UDP-glycosyltransferase 73C5 [Acorus gramineus]|uniref:Glycosyltransferase n=1 Tax=Acorus gramineus TaxID=55184 RepID=A0AAV9A515_ACOGR|nr:UDP-glycosyltransferase 73C5 [Acorus gramineus]